MFRKFKQKFLDFLSKKLEHRWQHCFLNILKKKYLEELFDEFFSERIGLPINLGSYRTYAWYFEEYFLTAWSKQKYTFPYEYFMEWKFFLKVYSFSNVLRFGANMLQNVCEKFQAKLSKLISTCQKDSA